MPPQKPTADPRAGSPYTVAGYPEVAAQWHETLNGELSPADMSYGSKVRVWWRCPAAPDHVWQAAPGNRIGLGTGCPHCSGRRVGRARSLQAQRPEVAAQWHEERNRPLTAADVGPGSSLSAWWQCGNVPGHVWQTTVKDRCRTPGHGCPYCASQRVGADNNLEAQAPHVALEWHPTKNGALAPHLVAAGSGKKAWWRCARKHEWAARIVDRARGATACPFCAGKRIPPDSKNLAARSPRLAREWHPTYNGQLTPRLVAAGSGKKVWWRCARKHEWETRVVDRFRRGAPCPYCAGKRQL